MWRYTSDGRVDGRPVAHSRAFDHGIQTQKRTSSVGPPRTIVHVSNATPGNHAPAEATSPTCAPHSVHVHATPTPQDCRPQRAESRGTRTAGAATPRVSRLAWRAVLTTGQAAQSAHETRRRVTRPCPPFAPATGSRRARPGRERGEGGSCGEGAVERELFRGRGP